MAWTYNIATDVGKVRFLCGDTDTNDQLLQDAEIEFLLTESSNRYRAAAAACRAIAARLYNALTLDPADGGVSYNAKERADGFLELAKGLDQKAATSGGASGYGVFAGGISRADKESRERDTDRVVPAFSTALHSESDLNDRLSQT